MATTTSYGTWTNRVEPYTASFEQDVYESLGDYADDYDIEALTAEYRNAINEALPNGVWLTGSEFIGPYYDEDADFGDAPVDEFGSLDFKAIVDGIDFWEIAARHDKTA